ncbi:MAG: hypothetical protein IR158_11790 [Cellulomonas sp.]|uniref:hypothetical protein n=1 Tax=Cellulomonas sp. TaxID=40001 RepID=UPI001A00A042|nr:hypothetical protein [Cellulomonas sp.]MBF0688430.1 hypothetical protein [Cellulomonas sp.]
MRTTPYAVPRPSEVIAEPWFSGGLPVGRLVAGWDYESLLKFERVVRVNLRTVLEQAGLEANTPVALHVRYWASGSMVRCSAVVQGLVADSTGWSHAHLIAPVHGSDLAGELVLETTLVRQDDVESNRFTARRAGSILWRDAHHLALEGEGGLLPVAPVRFREQGFPPDAAWYISLDGADWSAPAMGNLLVLLNVDNSSVVEALEPGDSGSALLWDALMVDVVCDLVRRALDDDEFRPVQSDEDELSTGGLVTGLIRSFLRLPGEELDDAVARLRGEWVRDPSLVRSRAQSALKFPRAVKS